MRRVVVVTVVVCNTRLVQHEHDINGNSESEHTGVGVILGSNVVQLDDVAALVAALNGAVA